MYRLVYIFIVLVILLTGCNTEQPSEQVSETRLLLDTFCTITIHGAVDRELLYEAFELCAEYEALFSITAPGSDVWCINHAGGEPVVVDSRTIEVIRAGLEFGELTDGMFDITIGRLSRLWDFSDAQDGSLSHEIGCCDIDDTGDGSLSFVRHIPTDEEIMQARATVDYRQVIISGDTVQLLNPDAWIDLGAVAKGYIGDRLAEFLVERGVTGALISLGGDIIAAGNRRDGEPWRIALRDPFGGLGERLNVFEITGASVISSGTYERRFEVDGVIYHHILDPNTGMPVNTDVVSATVVVENALFGEGLSTAAVLLGSERALELFGRVEAQGLIRAVLVLENGEVITFEN